MGIPFNPSNGGPALKALFNAYPGLQKFMVDSGYANPKGINPPGRVRKMTEEGSQDWQQMTVDAKIGTGGQAVPVKIGYDDRGQIAGFSFPQPLKADIDGNPKNGQESISRIDFPAFFDYGIKEENPIIPGKKGETLTHTPSYMFEFSTAKTPENPDGQPGFLEQNSAEPAVEYITVNGAENTVKQAN